MCIEQVALSRQIGLAPLQSADGGFRSRDWTGELCRRDLIRNQRLMELGWEVKRFWVYQVRDDLEECTRWVRTWVQGAAG